MKYTKTEKELDLKIVTHSLSLVEKDTKKNKLEKNRTRTKLIKTLKSMKEKLEKDLGEKEGKVY